MDVTRTRFYKDCRKHLSSSQLRVLRRKIRRQIKEDRDKVTEILKPFAGRKLDEETKQEVFQALEAGFIQYQEHGGERQAGRIVLGCTFYGGANHVGMDRIRSSFRHVDRRGNLR